MGSPRAGSSDRAPVKGSRRDRSGIDWTQVHETLQSGTKRRYEDANRLWLEYVPRSCDLLSPTPSSYSVWIQLLIFSPLARPLHSFCAEYKKDPENDAYDLETLKDFVQEVGYGMDGNEGGDDRPSSKSLGQVWEDFTAQFRRHHDPIPRNITLSVTNFMKTTLQAKLSLPLYKQERRYGTSNHLIRLGVQMWENDWYAYKKPGVRVSTWSEILDYGFASARVGEYLESTSRAGLGQGLHHRDIIFSVFRNENGKAEFAAQIARDAKSTTWTPDKRPEQAIHEGSKPQPFLLNPILPKLVMCIARGAFRDYGTMEELLEIPPPPEKQMYHLHWDPRILDIPFYDSLTGEIEKANSFNMRLNALARRAGYLKPPTTQDLRAEGLHIIDQLYFTAQRMKHREHISEDTYRNHYQPENPGTDGHDAYLEEKLGTIVTDLFRDMTVSRTPNLLQSLPAEKKFYLETSPEFVAVNRELEDLKGKPPSEERERRRRKLYLERRKLKAVELRKTQESQSWKHRSTEGEEIQSIGSHGACFARFCSLTPERRRLAKSMFVVGWLRSPKGQSVLQDMIALYQQETEVTFRPSLEPKNCHCSGTGHDGEPDKKYLTREYDLAELCFLCDEWTLGSSEWEEHCQAHLDSPETFPVQCDPLMYCGTIAAAGYCPVCLGNPALPASKRMCQFVKREAWKDHVTGCVQSMDECSVAGCPLPWCTTPWEGALKRRFHLQSVHFVEFTNGTKRGWPDAAAEDKAMTDTYPCQPRRVDEAGATPDDAFLPTMEYEFVDETMEIIQSQAFDRISREGRKREKQTTTSDRSPTVIADDSPLPSTTCLSTNVTDHTSLPTPLIDGYPEPFENPSTSSLLGAGSPNPQPSSPVSSHNMNTPRDVEEDDLELPSFQSLLNHYSTLPSSDSRDSPSQKRLTDPTLQVHGWAELLGADGTPILQESQNHELDARGLGTADTKGEQMLTALALDGEPVPKSGNNSPSKRSGPNTDQCSRCEADISHSSKRQRKHLNVHQQRALCHAHRLKDELQAADSEWALRGYPRIGWRRLDTRLQKFSIALRDILQGASPSFYRSELESAVANRTPHRYRCMENATAGYYGPRGQQVMMEHIIFHFGSELRRQAVEDRLLRTVGVPDYVLTVLVPELVVMLIKEDMKVCEETARQILRESAPLGETLHDDV